MELRLDRLEALHDPLLGPATEEQLRLLLGSAENGGGDNLFLSATKCAGWSVRADSVTCTKDLDRDAPPPRDDQYAT